MRGSIDFVESEMDTRDYDSWLDTLTDASKRLDDLQAAVAEVRNVCQNRGASPDEVLEVLDRLAV